MGLPNNGRNITVDLAKYIAALMVIAIHTNLFHDINQSICFFIVQVVCRIAVPFFAVCSGYFLVNRFYCKAPQDRWNSFLKYWKKLIWIYGVWTLLYLPYSIPMWIEIGWFSPFAFVDYFVGALTKGSHYHLWYLWGMIYTLPVFYLIISRLPRRFWGIIAMILWIIQLISGSYSHLFQTSSTIQVIGKLDTPLRLLPLLLVGAWIGTHTLLSTKSTLAGTIFCFIGLCAEAFHLRSAGHEAVSYILFTQPLSYFLFQAILRINVPLKYSWCDILGPVSMFVYCVHPMFLETSADLLPSSTIHFLFVSITSTATALLYHKITNHFRKKRALCSN